MACRTAPRNNTRARFRVRLGPGLGYFAGHNFHGAVLSSQSDCHYMHCCVTSSVVYLLADGWYGLCHCGIKTVEIGENTSI